MLSQVCPLNIDGSGIIFTWITDPHFNGQYLRGLLECQHQEKVVILHPQLDVSANLDVPSHLCRSL